MVRPLYGLRPLRYGKWDLLQPCLDCGIALLYHPIERIGRCKGRKPGESGG